LIIVEYIQAIILGFVQGLTEFLPISSSAHLRIVGQLLPENVDPGAAFTAITQLGTETAVLVFFWRDIVRIIRAWFGSLTGKVKRDDPDARMGWLIIIGSIPIGVLGFLLEDYIEVEPSTVGQENVSRAPFIKDGLEERRSCFFDAEPS